ncbi:MAG: hypothetical protein R3247_14485 [Rhodothermales bacterium]|nr:hypothetical protein [Rhodothermales bacterium]
MRLPLLLLGTLLCAAAQAQHPAPAEVTDAGWGIRFTPPAGWTQHPAPQGYLFLAPTQEAVLAVLPHAAHTLGALRAEAQQGIADGAGTQLRLRGTVASFGANGLVADYEGWIEGSPGRARAVGLVAPGGDGVTVLVATAPQHYSEAYAAVAEAVAESVVFEAPPAAQTAAPADAPAARPAGGEEQEWYDFFHGCRLSYFNRYDSGYGGGGYLDETTIDLCPGYFTFGDRSETVFNTRDLSGSDAYLQRGGRGAGQWTVARQNGESVLQLHFHDGTVRAYVLGYEDGKTFLDGRRWLRTCNPDDSVVEARPQCQ